MSIPKKSQSDMVKDAKRLYELRGEIFDMANSYAGDNNPSHIAVTLHQVCNMILDANRYIKIESGFDIFNVMNNENNQYKKDRECGDCVYFWDCHYEHAGVISPHEDFEPMCEE